MSKADLTIWEFLYGLSNLKIPLKGRNSAHCGNSSQLAPSQCPVK